MQDILEIGQDVILNTNNAIYFRVWWILEVLLILVDCPAFYCEITITTILTTEEEAFSNISSMCVQFFF